MRKESVLIPCHRSWRLLGACAVLIPGALGVFGLKSVSAQCMYEIVAEISLPGCGLQEFAPITATAINDHGVVVGFYFDCAFNEKPFMWSEETGFVAIPLPPGASRAEPMDINNNGEIVGSLVRPALGLEFAFHWKAGVWTELPSLPDSTNTFAYAINDDGIIAGESSNFIRGPAVACMWEGGKITELKLPSGPNSAAFDVSNSRAIVGRMGGSPTPFVPFLWTPQSAVAIPTLDGVFRSEALALNEDNAITGQAFVTAKSGSVPRRSWLFQKGMLTDLGHLPDADHRTIAFDINNAGQIVGRSSGLANATDKPFLWQHGAILEIQPLIINPPIGLQLADANAINNLGQIVVHDPGRASYVLSPIDRPLGDVNFDCVVDERDLTAVLDDWGSDKLGHLTDIVTNSTFQPPGDGNVDGADLAVVLGNWSVFSSQSSPQRSK